MIPLFKLGIIFAKKFQSPLLNVCKWLLRSHQGVMRKRFIVWGNKLNAYYYRVDSKIKRQTNPPPPPQLEDEEAIDEFLEFFFEIFFLYFVLGGLAVNEAIKGHYRKKEEEQIQAKKEAEYQWLLAQVGFLTEENKKLNNYFQAQITDSIKQQTAVPAD